MTSNPGPDSPLLRRYADEGSQDVFSELVQRYVGFVYTTAMRVLNGDAHSARDVAQIVFTDLARKAPKLSDHRNLVGWLHTSTRCTAAKLIRTASRRRAREREARRMTELTHDDSALLDWSRLQPLVDEALGELKPAQREAVLLRYFRGHTFAEIGGRLGISESAARSSLDRGLKKLNRALARRGIVSTATAMSAALSPQVSMAVPAELVGSIVTHVQQSLASTGLATRIATSFVNMTRFQLGVTTGVIVGSAALFIARASTTTAYRQQIATLTAQLQVGSRLGAENQRLKSQWIEDATTARAETAELVRLQDQVKANRAQLASVRAANPKGPPTPVMHGVIKYDFSGFVPGGVDEEAKLIIDPPPVYPPKLLNAGVGGYVEVEFVVDGQGLVHRARLGKMAKNVPTNPAFGSAALEAVRRWRYQPALRAGVPVERDLHVGIEFRPVIGPAADSSRN